MKNGNHKFRHESLQDRDTIAALIESLQQGLSKGKLTFDDADNAITLKPSGLLNLAIEASESGELNVIEVRISWQGDSSGKLKKELRISTD
jgi:amphi-Trp domain-containing protein